MIIRPATSADRTAVLLMTVRFISDTSYAALVTPNVAAIGALFDYLAPLGGVFVAVHPMAGVVGMFVAVVQPHLLSGELAGNEVAWWVNPEHRGSTAAMRLLNAGERWAVAQGARTFALVAPADSQVGRLYERRGYHPVETAWQRSFAA